MKRIHYWREAFPCVDYEFEGNCYFVWFMEVECADGQRLRMAVRIPGSVNGGSKAQNANRRRMAAGALINGRHQLKLAIVQHGGLKEKE